MGEFPTYFLMSSYIAYVTRAGTPKCELFELAIRIVGTGNRKTARTNFHDWIYLFVFSAFRIPGCGRLAFILRLCQLPLLFIKTDQKKKQKLNLKSCEHLAFKMARSAQESLKRTPTVNQHTNNNNYE